MAWKYYKRQAEAASPTSSGATPAEIPTVESNIEEVTAVLDSLGRSDLTLETVLFYNRKLEAQGMCYWAEWEELR